MTKPPAIDLPPVSGPSQAECDHALGQYMRAWGYVEVAMMETIRKLLDTDPISSQIVIRALPDMRGQRDLALELAQHRLSKNDAAKLDKLLLRVKKSATRRNRIVHGTWVTQLILEPKSSGPRKVAERKLVRTYFPAQQQEREKLMSGRGQKAKSDYEFWPDRLVQEAKAADGLAKDLNRFMKSVTLVPPRIPLPAVL